MQVLELDRLAAFWHSARYLRPHQITGRILYWLNWKLVYPRFPAAVRRWCELAARSCRRRAGFQWPADPAASPGHRGDNRFCFLNETVDFGEHIDWNPLDRSLLWRFHLHYFDWAPNCEPGLLARHVESWIESNPPGSWPGWHPYPTSLRIVNWIRAAQADESIAEQSAFLEANLEYHLGGNHLLENARALLAAGLYFEGAAANRWRSTALQILRREIPEQVLADGGHVERSPYYHARMLRLVLDAIELLEGNGCDVPPELRAAAAKMTGFHRALRHQDGGLPLFHDGLDSAGDVLPVDSGPRSFPASGYYILEGPQGRLIADYGAPGDCYNPAHQHAGIFSFEISTGNQRVAVDSGTYTYTPGPERDRLRSTAAHNTVRVDSQDQFQVWHGFRVGRRAWVSDLKERRGPEFEVISASHNGYRRLGVEHRRSIVNIPGAGWLVFDELAGHGSHQLESFLHLAPGITPVVKAGRICLMPVGWAVWPAGLRDPEVLQDRYSPAPGVAEASQTLLFRAGPQLPGRFGYFLGPVAPTSMTWQGPNRFRIEILGSRLEVGYN